jgi:hypothetical protein
MMSLFEYRFQLELIQEYLKDLNLKIIYQGTEPWHMCMDYLRGVEGEREGEGEGTEGV